MNPRTGLYNTLTAFFLGLSVVVFLCSLLMLAGLLRPPAPFAPATPTLPAVLIMPTDTPSATPSDTPTPSRTFTPTATPTDTLTPTHTPTNTHTPTDTLTPSATPIPSETPIPTATFTETPIPTATPIPTDTPTLTPTPIPTATSTPQPTPVPTRAFAFLPDPGMPQFTAYVTGGQFNCDFQGIGGLVIGVQQDRLTTATGITAFVSSATGFSQSIPIDTDPLWGWLVPVDNKTNSLTYTVELRNAFNEPISPQVRVTFPNDCNRNLALINFTQQRPF